MKKYLYFFLAIIMCQPLTSREFYLNYIPNIQKFSCSSCHVNPFGGGMRNVFGQDVEATLTSGIPRWDLLYELDSDGDGFTNGQELQDENGTWTFGSPMPGDESLVTKPWDPDDFPNVGSVLIDLSSSLINIFPNPSSEEINISIEEKAFDFIEIIDLNGNKVFLDKLNSNNQYSLNLSKLKLSTGQYFAILRNKINIVRKAFYYIK